MIVTRSTFDKVIEILMAEPRLATDTETTGLRMYHGDRLFSIIIARNENEAFYFNFNPFTYSHVLVDGKIVETKNELPFEIVLSAAHLELLKKLFADKAKLWYIQNAANFDVPMLAQSGIKIGGTIHCTRACARVEYNNHYGPFYKVYGLDAQLKRHGRSKDDKVKEYVKQWKLKSEVLLEGKLVTKEIQHYDKVPFDLIVPYALTDAKETFFLGDWQEKSILKKDLEQPKLGNQRSMRKVMENERRLQKTIFNMKDVGIKIDKPYVERAIKYENDRIEKAARDFKKETGIDFQASDAVFRTVFANEREKWGVTDKGNPSFDSDCLSGLENPAARSVLNIRDAKSKSDFYQGFLYFSDSNGVIHPDYNPEGTTHGRFSSSEPNFQNLTSEESEEEVAQEFVVRRAIIPRPGFILIMPDYVQMEYKFMLELACRNISQLTPLGIMVNDGFDFHDATVMNAKAYGANVVRKQAKVANFLTLYGGGAQKLADALGISLDEATTIRRAIFSSAPEIKNLIKTLSDTAQTRGYVINWMGRRCYFDNANFAYKAPNYIVSGGCADVVKLAMNQIDDLLEGYKSRMVMSVHDELPIEVHESEIHIVPKIIQEIMENAFKAKYIPLNSSMEWSDKSLADKIKGYPV